MRAVAGHPADRPAVRLALGVALTAAVSFGAALPLPYLPVLLVMLLLLTGGPPPPLWPTLLLVAVLALALLLGLLLGELLQISRMAGVLLLLLAIGTASAVAQRPNGVLLSAFMIIGVALVGIIASQSSAAGLTIAQDILIHLFIALVMVQLLHLLLPNRVALPSPPPPPAGDAGWVGLRAAIVMAPPVLITLTDPATYIPLILKGSTLAQQAHAGRARDLAVATVLSTLIGGLVTLAIWLALRMWPSLLHFALLLGLATLLVARNLYRIVPSRFGGDHWINLLVTYLILIGPAVADSQTSDDIERELLIRFLLFLALSVYAAVAVRMIDSLRPGRAADPLPG